MMAQKEPKHVAYYLCIITNTIIINIIVVLTGSKLCFTINWLSYHTTGWLLLELYLYFTYKMISHRRRLPASPSLCRLAHSVTSVRLLTLH